jgi:hypothetical protein
MSLFVQETKDYEAGVGKVYDAAIGAIDGLEGKIIRRDVDAQEVEAKFDKKIHGHVLGDRTQIKVVVSSLGDEHSQVSVEAFPLDAVGRRQMFGARKGVTETIVHWFFTHLEHRLKKQEM